MGRHLLRPLILGVAAALLLAAGPAAGKIPFFSVEVSPPDPVAGDVVLVTVLLWDDASHTQPATWSSGPAIEGLLEFRSDAGTVPLTLQRLDDATYLAQVTLGAGSWRLVAFPLGVARTAASYEGYPTDVRLKVSERFDLSAGGVVAVGAALGIVTLLVGAQVRRDLRDRRLRSATG